MSDRDCGVNPRGSESRRFVVTILFPGLRIRSLYSIVCHCATMMFPLVKVVPLETLRCCLTNSSVYGHCATTVSVSVCSAVTRIPVLTNELLATVIVPVTVTNHCCHGVSVPIFRTIVLVSALYTHQSVVLGTNHAGSVSVSTAPVIVLSQKLLYVRR